MIASATMSGLTSRARATENVSPLGLIEAPRNFYAAVLQASSDEQNTKFAVLAGNAGARCRGSWRG